MKVSEKGLAFLAAHEGFVSRGYLDPGGVVTIGYGFTMRSRVFASWWRAREGQPLRVNDRISRKECDMLLRTLLEEEYVPPVRKTFRALPQHQVDSCASIAYNLGPRALRWKWAKALKENMVSRAANLLRVTGTTAGGRQLAGLVRRRAEEADLLERGIYARSSVRHEAVVARQAPEPDVEEAQELLRDQGIAPDLDIDGWMGPKTEAAILRYQKLHPHLNNDGILGPATLSQLRKDAHLVKDAARKAARELTPIVSGGGLLSWLADLPWLWVATAIGIAMVAVFLWHRRDVLKRRFNRLTGRAEN